MNSFTLGGNSQAQGEFLYKHDLVQQGEDGTISILGVGFIRWNDVMVD